MKQTKNKENTTQYKTTPESIHHITIEHPIPMITIN